MPWLKASDNAATHPIVMRGGDQANELFGFVLRCALQSAAHCTDYFIDESVAWMIGGPNTERLARAARKAGYWTPHRKDGHKGWLLVDDPEFLHIRLKAEIDWERQQRADASNPALTVPVRLRDGDACRYCGNVVYWNARRGNRRGTYDHRVPGTAATVETLVVACGACNSSRRDDTTADTRKPLLPAPLTPFYGPVTVAFLATHGHVVTPSTPPRPGTQPDTAPPRPGTQPDTAPATPPPAGHRAPRDPATGGTPRTDAHHDDAPTPPAAHHGSADRLPTEVGSAGSGRDRDGPGAATYPRRPRARRGRPRTSGDQ